MTIDWTSVTEGAIGTFIGAFLGFASAFYLARRQLKWERELEAQDAKAEEEAILKSAVTTCAINIENGVNFKSQFLSALQLDLDAMSTAMASGDLNTVVNVAQELPNFFQGYTPLGQAELPSISVLRFVFDDVPMLMSFVHRAAEASKDLNVAIVSRNALLHEYARANAQGMKPQELSYFMQMLVAQGSNLSSHTNDSIFFSELVHDQIHALGKAKYGEGKFAKYALTAEKAALMPSHGEYAGFREHLKTDFSGPRPVRRWFFRERPEALSE